MGRHSVPRHVAIIMDGNGRWAAKRGLPRTEGHKAGFDVALGKTVDAALDFGVEWLTMYAFSTENWRRPKKEVKFLLDFSRELLFRKRDEFIAKGVRVRFIGRRTDRRLPRKLVRTADETEELTKKGRRLNLTIALNYGSRAEITDAITRIAEDKKTKITESSIKKHFYAPELPDVDLMIRTSGEMRVSNFLLWQGAYAELIFTSVLWPDFGARDLQEALAEYKRRSRRFGAVR